jgi:hypothetical protein
MPAFGITADIVDRSHNGTHNLPDYVGLENTIDKDGILVTVNALEEFYKGKFGHVSYLPEYAVAIQKKPTKVLFNIRDPRDIIVSEYYNMMKLFSRGNSDHALWNFRMKDSRTVYGSGDPIKYLIEFASCRWLNWLGWMKHDFVYTVKYEDLRLNGIETLEKIKEFLAPEITINTAWNFEHLKPRHGNPTFRRGVPGEWKDVFTDEHKKQAAEQLGATIRKLGYTL